MPVCGNGPRGGPRRRQGRLGGPPARECVSGAHPCHPGVSRGPGSHSAPPGTAPELGTALFPTLLGGGTQANPPPRPMRSPEPANNTCHHRHTLGSAALRAQIIHLWLCAPMRRCLAGSIRRTVAARAGPLGQGPWRRALPAPLSSLPPSPVRGVGAPRWPPAPRPQPCPALGGRGNSGLGGRSRPLQAPRSALRSGCPRVGHAGTRAPPVSSGLLLRICSDTEPPAVGGDEMPPPPAGCVQSHSSLQLTGLCVSPNVSETAPSFFTVRTQASTAARGAFKDPHGRVTPRRCT